MSNKKVTPICPECGEAGHLEVYCGDIPWSDEHQGWFSEDRNNGYNVRCTNADEHDSCEYREIEPDEIEWRELDNV